jgi:hypothetical protein
MGIPTNLPTRLHHTAYVTRNMEKTRLAGPNRTAPGLLEAWLLRSHELSGAERPATANG